MGFVATIGLIPVSWIWGLDLFSPERWGSSPPGTVSFYWLLTGLPACAGVTWIIWLITTGLSILWIGKHFSSGLRIRPPGTIVAIAIQLTVFTSAFFLPIVQAGNVHISATRLGTRVFYLSEMRNISSIGYFSIWECEQTGNICQVIENFELADYGLRRLSDTRIALVGLLDISKVAVVVNDQSVFAFAPQARE